MSRSPKRRSAPSARQNVIVHSAWQLPAETRLRTDPDWSRISWPFGDDVADVMTTLDPSHLRAWEAAVRACARHEAQKLPVDRRAAFFQKHDQWVRSQKQRARR